uniref:Macro domain-containing protein n=1 Tax=Paramormyrops kingsleyae TaxID=1676925 RepID=A0A3B3RLA1_9TELE
MTKYKTIECVVNNPVWTVGEKEISSVAKQDVILLHDQTKGVLTVAGLEVGSVSTYCKVQMPNGLIITVAKADLCKYQADVVVNASNEGLQHIGGLALALLQAAGPQLQDVCDRYRSRNGDLKPGDAIITEAGQLPCQYVIHAVGPRFSDWDRSTAVRLLRRVVRQALNLVVAKGCRSVAIPAISSGIFGFPLDLCAETIAAVLPPRYRLEMPLLCIFITKLVHIPCLHGYCRCFQSNSDGSWLCCGGRM